MSRFSGSLTGCGGVEATTSGSMADGGRGDGSSSLGRGNSVWTICARRQRAATLLCFVGNATGTQGETHIVQPLEHNLQHARPFGAVVSQLRAIY